MRIFRTLMLLAGVTAFMPSPPEDKSLDVAMVEMANVEETGIISSATTAISDLAGFCGRQPGVCETAGYVANRLEAKAKYSVRLIYEWAAESSAEPRTSPFPNQADATDPMATGSTRALMADGTAVKGQSTLRLDDLIPEWRGPLPRQKKG
jgi:hypothetical protein